MVVDVEEFITVQDYVNQRDCGRIWLCPRLINHPRFNPEPTLQGYECTKNTIPKHIRDKRVVRHFREDKLECIIWENN